MSDKVKIFKRSDKYRENWDRIFLPFDTDGAVYNWKTGELFSKEEYKHIAYGAYVLENGRSKIAIIPDHLCQ